jgi:hypothetical protein
VPLHWSKGKNKFLKINPNRLVRHKRIKRGYSGGAFRQTKKSGSRIVITAGRPLSCWPARLTRPYNKGMKYFSFTVLAFLFCLVAQPALSDSAPGRSIQPDQESEKKSSQLLRECRLGNPQNVETLIKVGATAPLEGESLGQAWLEAAGGDVLEGSGKRDNIGVLSFLKSRIKNVNVKDPSGRTALIAAASKGQTAQVKWLLENGADANSQDTMGETAAHKLTGMFSTFACGDIIAALKKSKADFKLKNKLGLTASEKMKKVEEKFESELKYAPPGNNADMGKRVLASANECGKLLQ